MKKKKLLATILSMCMTASMLTGCGGSAASSSTTDTTAKDTAKTEAAQAAAETDTATTSASLMVSCPEMLRQISATTSASLDQLTHPEVGQGTIAATPEMYAPQI